MSASTIYKAIPAGSSTLYDVLCPFAGTPASSEILAKTPIPRQVTFPANFTDAAGDVGTNPAAQFDIDVQDDGVSIGTISIGTGGAFTFTTASGTEKTVAAGSILTFVAPSTTDANIANIAATLKGAA
jgi:hypothetical protein